MRVTTTKKPSSALLVAERIEERKQKEKQDIIDRIEKAENNLGQIKLDLKMIINQEIAIQKHILITSGIITTALMLILIYLGLW